MLVLLLVMFAMSGCILQKNSTRLPICNKGEDKAFITSVTTVGDEETLSLWQELEIGECVQLERSKPEETLAVLAVDNQWKAFKLLQIFPDSGVQINSRKVKKCIPLNTSGVKIPYNKKRCNKATYTLNFVLIEEDTVELSLF